MPTYHYKCKSCKREFEEFQRMSDEALVTCPSCKEASLVRIMSGAGLVFKGSGFYITDYKGKSPGSNPLKTEPKTEQKAPQKTDAAGPDNPGSAGKKD